MDEKQKEICRTKYLEKSDCLVMLYRPHYTSHIFIVPFFFSAIKLLFIPRLVAASDRYHYQKHRAHLEKPFYTKYYVCFDRSDGHLFLQRLGGHR